MQRKSTLVIIVVALAAVALAAGLLLSGCGRTSSSLALMSASDLVAKLAQPKTNVKAISGDITWSNAVLGGLPLEVPGVPSGLSALTQGGQAHLWAKDGKARLESSAAGGGSTVVFGGKSVWVYSATGKTATEYVLPSSSAGSTTTSLGSAGSTNASGSATTASPTTTVVTPQAIANALAQLAPTATVAVSGQESVAGRECYLLTLTPKSANTVLGSVKAAIDGENFIPLQVQVFAKGETSSVLSLRFTTVSYSAVQDSQFVFTPPTGTKVQHRQISMPTSKEPQQGKTSTPEKPLTLEQAKAQAGFPLLGAGEIKDPPFQGAHVIASRNGFGPAAVLRYGQGFGSVVLAEVKLTPEQLKSLSAALTQVPLLPRVNLNGASALKLTTPLGSVLVWTKGDLAVVAAGSVTPDLLQSFAVTVH